MKKAAFLLIVIVLITALASCDLLFVQYLDGYNENMEYTCKDRGGHIYLTTEERISCTTLEVTNECSFCSEKEVTTKTVTANHDFVDDVCTRCGEGVPDSVGLKFALEGDGYVLTSIGSCTDKNVRIPATYDSLPVIGIADSAFKYSNIESVKIPDSITSIGSYAFSTCSSLVSVIIPDTVSKIGDYAFYSCTALESIFVDAENEHYKSIDGDLYTFDGKVLLKYAGAKLEENVVIPEGVEKIESFAFSGAGNMVTVTIPESVTSVEYGAFVSCKSLTEIIVAVGNPVYTAEAGDLYRDEGKTLLQYAVGKKGYAVSIPSGVETVAPYAYYDADNINAIYVSNTVVEFGEYSFYGCDILVAVYMSDSVRTIGTQAFSNCPYLMQVLLGAGTETIGDKAFFDAYFPLRVLYKGDATQWMEVNRGSNAFGLFFGGYTVYYYSETAPDSIIGYYWYLDSNGQPKLW